MRATNTNIVSIIINKSISPDHALPRMIYFSGTEGSFVTVSLIAFLAVGTAFNPQCPHCVIRASNVSGAPG